MLNYSSYQLQMDIFMSDILVETVFGNCLKEKFTLGEAITILKSKNLIDIGELAEQAISLMSGVEQCDKNMPYIDLVSGKQIKHARTNPEHAWSYSCLKANITIRGQNAPILAVVTERVTEKQYFFYFPYKAYQYQNGNTLIIPFETNGAPRKTNKWWRYEVKSFKELCELAK